MEEQICSYNTRGGEILLRRHRSGQVNVAGGGSHLLRCWRSRSEKKKNRKMKKKKREAEEDVKNKNSDGAFKIKKIKIDMVENSNSICNEHNLNVYVSQKTVEMGLANFVSTPLASGGDGGFMG
ncbi:hypothetical protein Ddye_001790 [Dipteronia dyeriana]|uniref:Uncharacterized protein n=1 Tax=Dipteronia dyeriana TaxID=168575 RepID=A0AAD9XPR0_9ROSI|nr:hypothetical protein Ddye_001790 [Dipteronia dyeriana]